MPLFKLNLKVQSVSEEIYIKVIYWNVAESGVGNIPPFL
jgi:hypothetical protein